MSTTELQRSPGVDAITGVILAGGRARRMGGRDKGLIPLAGRPMIEYVLSALRAQTAAVLISANRNLARYRDFGVAVLPDARPGYAGPLAGIARGMEAARTPFVLCVPCDAPLLPHDLGVRLGTALAATGGVAAVAHDGRRRQPLFALLSCDLKADLEQWLAGGAHRVGDWIARHHPVEIDFSESAEAFRNVNDASELAAVGAVLARRGSPA